MYHLAFSFCLSPQLTLFLLQSLLHTQSWCRGCFWSKRRPSFSPFSMIIMASVEEWEEGWLEGASHKKGHPKEERNSVTCILQGGGWKKVEKVNGRYIMGSQSLFYAYISRGKTIRWPIMSVMQDQGGLASRENAQNGFEGISDGKCPIHLVRCWYFLHLKLVSRPIGNKEFILSHVYGKMVKKGRKINWLYKILNRTQ